MSAPVYFLHSPIAPLLKVFETQSTSFHFLTSGFFVWDFIPCKTLSGAFPLSSQVHVIFCECEQDFIIDINQVHIGPLTVKPQFHMFTKTV